MSPLNTVRTALRGLSVNKLRAALTTLSIIIGVASVITMLALGNGARAAVEASFRFLGSASIHISARRKIEEGETVPVGKILSFEDGLHMATEADLVDQVAMSVGCAARVRHDRAVLDMSIAGSTFDILEMMPVQDQVQPLDWLEGEPLSGAAFVGRGRFFTPAEVLVGADVCVLGHKTSLDLFEGEYPLDRTVWVNRRRCTIIGVLVELETIDPTQRLRGRPNEALHMPISTAIQNLFDEEPSVTITARVVDESRMDKAKE